MNLKIVAFVVVLLAIAQTGWADGSDGTFKVELGSSWGPVRGTHFLAIGLADQTSGFDNEQALQTPVPSGILVAVHKQNGTNWTAPTGFYRNELRETADAGTTVVIDDIYLWATPDVRKTDLHLCQVTPPLLAEGLTYKLKLVSVPSGVTYSGPTEWDTSDKVITLPFYSTSDGTTGYKFKIEITAAQ